MMIRNLVWIFLFLSFGTYGQSLKCELMGEGNGDNVKLKWVPYSWPQNLEGFFIQKRIIANGKTSEWSLVNNDLIYPELSLNKAYGNVDKSASGQKRLKDKLKKMMDEGQAYEVLQKDFYEKILSKDAEIRNLRIGFLVDYDFALLHGFGLIDRNFSGAGIYEYGLFPKYEGQPMSKEPVSTFQWKYGEKPDMSLNVKSKIKRFGRKGGIQVIWTIDTDELRKKKIAGFYIYKKTGSQDFEKVNQNVIFLSVTNKKEQLIHQDVLLNDSIPVTYAAAPVSVFGLEGRFLEVPYLKANVEVYIAVPNLQIVSPANPKTREITLKWDFSKEDEPYIKGFRIERKANPNDKFLPVSKTVQASSRSFIDNTLPQKGTYYYRLVIIKSDNSILEGDELSTYYTFISQPLVPANLKGKYVQGRDKDYIQLEWERPIAADTLTKKYHIYLGKPSENQLYDDASIPLVTDNSFRLEIGTYERGQWKFAVSSVSGNGVESEKTDIVLVFAPSKVVPPVNNNYNEIANGRAKITWEYYKESVPDLAGFRIFFDGQQVADESVLKADVREWVSKPLESGKAYKYEIMAITTYQVESERRDGQVIVK